MCVLSGKAMPTSGHSHRSKLLLSGQQLLVLGAGWRVLGKAAGAGLSLRYLQEPGVAGTRKQGALSLFRAFPERVWAVDFVAVQDSLYSPDLK